MTTPDPDGGGAPPTTSTGSSIIPNIVHHTDVLAGVASIPDASVGAVLLDPPSLARPPSGPTVLDGLAVLYLSCKKARSFIVFSWRRRDLPRPPTGWFEAARHIWHNPQASGTQYELLIVWSTNPNLQPARVWTVPSGSRNKPVRLWRYLVDRYTGREDTVLLPFAGAGAAALACQQLGRAFVAFEAHPVLARLANARLTHRPLAEYEPQPADPR